MLTIDRLLWIGIYWQHSLNIEHGLMARPFLWECKNKSENKHICILHLKYVLKFKILKGSEEKNL